MHHNRAGQMTPHDRPAWYHLTQADRMGREHGAESGTNHDGGGKVYDLTLKLSHPDAERATCGQSAWCNCLSLPRQRVRARVISRAGLPPNRRLAGISSPFMTNESVSITAPSPTVTP